MAYSLSRMSVRTPFLYFFVLRFGTNRVSHILVYILFSLHWKRPQETNAQNILTWSQSFKESARFEYVSSPFLSGTLASAISQRPITPGVRQDTIYHLRWN